MSNTKTPTEITCEFVLKCAAKHGVTLIQEHRSWEKFTDAKTGHKLCVSYTKGEAPYVDTTVDITSLEGVLTRGKDAKENGKFLSLFVASSADGASLIEAAIKQMATGDSIRPTKRAAKKAPVAFSLEGAETSGPVSGSGSGSGGLHMLSGLEAE